MTAIWKKRLLAIILAVLAAAVCYGLWRTGLLQRLSNKDELIQSLRAGGPKGPLLCVAMQFVQVVIFAIPGEITQFASGYVFGAPLGFLYSVVGIMLGSAFNFYFARVFGRPALERFISHATLDKMDHALNSAKGKSALFLLFLLPGMPKDAMSYGAGIAEIGLGEFVVVTGLARSPSLLFSVLLGAQAEQRNYRAMVITALVGVAAIGGYYFYERRRKQNAGAP
ncbi:MAG TPA: TVP38/TMEM64 family protein [Bryobacterales bacterium]|nr:TVP38/TMEM64 family protein [Bryobacterales bacterium]